jgi:HAMP domain-containing protein
MSSEKSKRRLSNVTLTRKHHFRYMGLWVLLSGCMLLAFNIVLYMWLEERWQNMTSLAAELMETEIVMRSPVIVALVVELVSFMLAVTGLAMFTAHRIAGPYIRLRNACNDVADGNFDYSLRFRGYDRLEEVEEAFNGMMAAFRAELAKKGGDSG